MDMIWPQGAISEEELNRHESGINRVAWSGGIAVALVTAILLIFLITTQAAESWEYPVFISLAGVPLGYALFSNLIIRRMQLSLLERYKAQLVMKMSQLEELASRDELTGLYNRRYFYQAIQNELGKARAAGHFEAPTPPFPLGLHINRDEPERIEARGDSASATP